MSIAVAKMNEDDTAEIEMKKKNTHTLGYIKNKQISETYCQTYVYVSVSVYIIRTNKHTIHKHTNTQMQKHTCTWPYTVSRKIVWPSCGTASRNV